MNVTRDDARPDVTPVTPATRLLLTGAEAFPVLEELFLSAQDRIVAGFRVFDPDTRLRSPGGQAVGETWFDLILDTLKRGVRFELLLSDFDPIIQPHYHHGTWSSLRRLWAAAEVAGPDARFVLAHGLHPARVGSIPRLLLWPRVRTELLEIRDNLNAESPPRRRALLRDMPGLAGWIALDEDGVAVALSNGSPELYTTTHHQKVAVVDGRVLYIGGLDLDERRYDTPLHDRDGPETWHDVQLVTDGPVAAAAEAHLLATPAVVNAARPPVVASGTGLITTISCARPKSWPLMSPRPLHGGISARLKTLIAGARRSIYIETQFFRDRGIARALAQAAAANPALDLVMILPAAPDVIAFDKRQNLDTRFGEYLQTLCVRRVRRAFGQRVFFASPAKPVALDTGDRDSLLGAPIIYLHAKLSIFDDTDMIVSSANLNGRSMAWDTEAGVHIADVAFVSASRARALAHWLPSRAADLSVIARTLPVLRDMALTDARMPPDRRHGLLLPYDLRPAEEHGHALPGVPDEMV